MWLDHMVAERRKRGLGVWGDGNRMCHGSGRGDAGGERRRQGTGERSGVEGSTERLDEETAAIKRTIP